MAAPVSRIRQRSVAAVGAPPGAVTIGEVRSAPAGEVFSRGELGVARVIDMLSGEQLPRIC